MGAVAPGSPGAAVPPTRHDGVVRRVSVVGNSGSGKSTVAAALSRRLGVPHIELDSIFHQPEWRALPIEEFRRLVGAQIEMPGWVADGNYAQVQDLVWARAETAVWLDLPRRTVMRRIVARTVRRLVRREVLWNGNQERWSNLHSTDPEQSVVAWSWTQHGAYRDRYGAAAADPANAHLEFVRLRSPREVRRFLAGVGV